MELFIQFESHLEALCDIARHLNSVYTQICLFFRHLLVVIDRRWKERPVHTYFTCDDEIIQDPVVTREKFASTPSPIFRPHRTFK